MPNISSDGFGYILVVIDLYTRYGWCILIKNKKQETLKEAFEFYWKNDGRIPKYIWFDKESGITSKYFKKFTDDNNIILYHTENEGKSVFAERFIRTLKNLMWKHFTVVGNQKWNNDLVQNIVDKYNNKIHSSIGVSPFEASKNPEIIKDEIIKDNNSNNNLQEIQKFHIGDHVRIFKYKNKFEKGFTTKWTKEIFVISKVLKTKPITYRIIDLNNEEILGRFYSNELQKSSF